METTMKSWIETPDTDDTQDGVIYRKVSVNEEKGLIAFAEIFHDEFSGNPLEDCDGMGMIRSLNRRHINSIGQNELESIIEENPHCVALSYFEHGLCKWGVRGSLDCTPDFNWDGVSFAGIWIPDQCVLECMETIPEDERQDWLLKQAESACEVYTNFCNGEVYGFSLKVYSLRKNGDNILDMESDYRFDEEIYHEPCGGYYNWDSVVEGFEDCLSSL